MSVSRYGVLSVILCAASFHAVDAWACSYEQRNASIVWPLEEETGVRPPTDTHVWVNASFFGTDTPKFHLEDEAGESVAFTWKTTRPSTYGPTRWLITIMPTEPFAPSSRYTVRVTFGDALMGMTEHASRTFVTGTGVHDAPAPSVSDVTYVALESDEVIVDSCRPVGVYSTYLLRMKKGASEGWFRSVVYVEEGGLRFTNSARSVDFADDRRGEYLTVGNGFIVDDTYPCLTHTLVDIIGRETTTETVCAPALCIDLDESEPIPFETPGEWESLSTRCGLDDMESDAGDADVPDVGASDVGGGARPDTGPADTEPLGGCITAPGEPASPVPLRPFGLTWWLVWVCGVVVCVRRRGDERV